MAKKKSSRKTKVSKKKVSSRGFFKNPALVFSVALLIIALILISGLFKVKSAPIISTHLQSNVASLATATPSAKLPSPSPTHKVQPIPTYSGRSVRVPIVYYHYIGNNPNPGKDPLRDDLSVTPDIFEKQMKYIVDNGYQTIDFDTLYAALKGNTTLPSKAIILTFDDGYIDFYVNAFPILQKYHLHATSFIPTGKIDTSYYLHWDQIKQMSASGLISFEAHTIDHVSLPNLSESEIKKQVTESKAKLESEIGKPVNFMAYPYGTMDERALQAAKNAGYFGAAGTWAGNVESEGNIYDMPRFKVSGHMSLEQFENLVK